MKEDRLTYDELSKFNDEMIEDKKEFDKELRSRIAKQRMIIVGTPAFDSSEFEKVFQSAREEQKLLKELPKKKKTFKKEFRYVKRKFR